MNNEVNIIITSLDALEEWTPVLNADLGEEREVEIAEDALVGLRFAATPLRTGIRRAPAWRRTRRDSFG